MLKISNAYKIDVYVLGQPFFRAFIVAFDYNTNLIGTASKKSGYGSKIIDFIPIID